MVIDEFGRLERSCEKDYGESISRVKCEVNILQDRITTLEKSSVPPPPEPCPATLSPDQTALVQAITSSVFMKLDGVVSTFENHVELLQASIKSKIDKKEAMRLLTNLSARIP